MVIFFMLALTYTCMLLQRRTPWKKRDFGKTGLSTTLLGFGGFHLCEIPYDRANYLLNTYLDKGGNYIETAPPSYGDGESEIKIGEAVSHRRDDYIMVTKAHDRDYETCKKTLEQSFKNLKTDYIDVLLMHAVSSMDVLDQVLSHDGAIRAAEEAKKGWSNWSHRFVNAWTT